VKLPCRQFVQPVELTMAVAAATRPSYSSHIAVAIASQRRARRRAAATRARSHCGRALQAAACWGTAGMPRCSPPRPAFHALRVRNRSNFFHAGRKARRRRLTPTRVRLEKPRGGLLATVPIFGKLIVHLGGRPGHWPHDRTGTPTAYCSDANSEAGGDQDGNVRPLFFDRMSRFETGHLGHGVIGDEPKSPGAKGSGDAIGGRTIQKST
jgi:hypothetical protein